MKSDDFRTTRSEENSIFTNEQFIRFQLIFIKAKKPQLRQQQQRKALFFSGASFNDKNSHSSIQHPTDVQFA